MKAHLARQQVEKEDKNCLKLHARFMEAALSRLYQGKLVYVRQLYKNAPENVLVEVFSHSDKIAKRVILKIYKNALEDFEKSDSNYIRSVAVYYIGGIIGKKKYRAAYRVVSYQKYIDNQKSARIVVNTCSIPRLAPYNKLMPFIKSINIGGFE